MESIKSAESRANEGAVTLRDVAEKAGVHPGTVSRALQGDVRVAPATMQHIQRIAREMNYRPNIAARVLAMGKTQTIAIVTGPADEQHYALTLHYLEQELTASNYKRLVLNNQDLKRSLLSIVNTHSVDGVIAIDAFPGVDNLLHSAKTPMLPCVYAGVANIHWTSWSAVDVVKVELGGAVRQAIQALLDGGCQRIAYLATHSNMVSTSEVRAYVYTQMMEEVGFPKEIVNLEMGHSVAVRDTLRKKLTEYIDQHGAPDGLLCQNDEIAMLCYRVLKDFGLHIPEDVQLVGCDGLPYLEYFDPPISTICQPTQQMCALAWQFLQRRINAPSLPRQQATIEAQLQVRPSLKVGSG